jgi:homoserine kinase
VTWSHRPAVVRAPATCANLGPGFDALGLALGLHDLTEARVTGGGLDIEVSGEGEDTARRGEEHLVVTAMRAAFGAMGGQPPGIALRCVNAIPHGRGLGSSAAAICSGLLAARELARDGAARLPDEALFRLAVELEGHPDNVAACLAGGLTIAWRPEVPDTGAGARLLRAAVLDSVRAVVCVPPFPLATAEARRVLPATVPHRDAAANAGRSALLVAALTADPSVLFDATGDFLHQPYRARVMPDSAALLAGLRRAGVAAVISGAGPSVLALLLTGDEAGREVVDSIATGTGIAWRVIPLEIDRRGATLQPRGLDPHPPKNGQQGQSGDRVEGPGAPEGGLPPSRLVFSATHGPQPGECRGL